MSNMKAYVITTGVVFALLALAHVWRAVAEGPHLATEPSFVLTTAVTVALCVWAGYLLSRMPRP